MKKRPASSVVEAIILPCTTPRVARPIKTPPCPKNMPAKFWRRVCTSIGTMISRHSFRDIVMDLARNIGANINRVKDSIIEIVVFRHRKIGGKIISKIQKIRFDLNVEAAPSA